MKIKAIAFSDLHIEDWKKYSTNHSRFFAIASVLKQVSKLCRENKCDALFLGDMFHNPNHLDNFVLNHIFTWFRVMFVEHNIKIYAIDGNHDQSEMNTITNTSPSYINMLSTVFPKHIINVNHKSIDIGHYILHGIPYISNNHNYKKFVEARRKEVQKKKINILMIHTNLFGAVDTSGREVGGVENIPAKMNEFFKGFDLILSGHIHKPQTLSSKVLMLGSTQHQIVSDMGIQMGVWALYKDASRKFIPTRYPEFKYKDGKEDDFNLCIDKPKTINKKGSEIQLKFTTDKTTQKLAENYMKQKGIKNKQKKRLLIDYLWADR